MNEPRRTNVRVVLAVVGLLLTPVVLYVLSVGPAAWFVRSGYLSGKNADRVYYPLLAAAEQSPWLMSVLRAYIDLFV